jgi:hypothetical protein
MAIIIEASDTVRRQVIGHQLCRIDLTQIAGFLVTGRAEEFVGTGLREDGLRDHMNL